jgi:glutathione synthase/RimK-type ligase-like ATP-grasp enzyme
LKIRIEPYKIWSGGAKALAERAGILRATRRQVEKHGDFDLIINWGRTERRFNGEYVNRPERVAVACNKLEAAQVFGDFGVPQPDFTTDRDVARGWLRDNSGVVCRTLLRANSGRGIVFLDGTTDEEVPAAPLYTRYIRKSTEFRVHIIGGQVIDFQEKKRRLEVPDEEVNWQIRNHGNGFIYARSDTELPNCVSNSAVRAVDSLGLDFGAVDIGFNARREKCRVYEVNTAPGIEGSTLEAYFTTFQDLFPALRTGAYARRRQAA